MKQIPQRAVSNGQALGQGDFCWDGFEKRDDARCRRFIHAANLLFNELKVVQDGEISNVVGVVLIASK